VYEVIIYSLHRCLTAPNTGNSRKFNDMSSCEHYGCLYIATADDDMSVFIHCYCAKAAYKIALKAHKHIRAKDTHYAE